MADGSCIDFFPSGADLTLARENKLKIHSSPLVLRKWG